MDKFLENFRKTIANVPEPVYIEEAWSKFLAYRQAATSASSTNSSFISYFIAAASITIITVLSLLYWFFKPPHNQNLSPTNSQMLCPCLISEQQLLNSSNHQANFYTLFPNPSYQSSSNLDLEFKMSSPSSSVNASTNQVVIKNLNSNLKITSSSKRLANHATSHKSIDSEIEHAIIEHPIDKRKTTSNLKIDRLESLSLDKATDNTNIDSAGELLNLEQNETKKQEHEIILADSNHLKNQPQNLSVLRYSRALLFDYQDVSTFLNKTILPDSISLSLPNQNFRRSRILSLEMSFSDATDARRISIGNNFMIGLALSISKNIRLRSNLNIGYTKTKIIAQQTNVSLQVTNIEGQDIRLAAQIDFRPLQTKYLSPFISLGSAVNILENKSFKHEFKIFNIFIF